MFNRQLTIPLIIGLLGAALYINTIFYGWVFDDELYILRNEVVNKGIRNLWQIWTTDFLGGIYDVNLKLYRPIPSTLFALEWSIFGNNPIGGHLINVLLYGLICGASYIFIYRLFNNRLLALIASLLFCVHPLHVEVVANIKAHDELLTLLFLLFSAIYWLNFSEKDDKKNQRLSFLFWGLALLSKESSITFLAIYPLIYWYKKQDITWASAGIKSWPFIAFFGVYMLIRSAIIGPMQSAPLSIIDNSLVGISEGGNLLATKFYILGMYLGKFFYPQTLSCDYSVGEIPEQTFTNIGVLFSLLSLITLALITFKLIPKRHPIAFGLIWGFATLSLTCNFFILIGFTFGERFMFTPSLGFCIALSAALMAILEKIKVTNWKIILSLVIVLSAPYTAKTLLRSPDWQSNSTLFSADVINAPNSIRTQEYYANELIQRMKTKKDSSELKALSKEVIQRIDFSLKHYPYFIKAFRDKGMTYNILKQCDLAIESFERAEKLSRSIPTDHKEILSELSNAYNSCKEHQKSLLISRQFPETTSEEKYYKYKTIGINHFNLNKFDSASIYFKKAQEQSPNDTEIKVLISKTLNNTGDLKGAIKLLEKDTSSTDSETQYQLAISYYRSGNTPQARIHVEKSLAINPSNGNALFTQAMILHDDKKYNEAITIYQKAIKINPGFFKAYFNMGNSFFAQNNIQKALEAYEKTIAINPQYKNAYTNAIVCYRRLGNTTKANELEAKASNISR